MNIPELFYNEEISGCQNGFDSQHLYDLVGFVHDNRNSAFGLLGHQIPYYESTVIVHIYHPCSPDTLRLYLFTDENGDCWPYGTCDVLTDVKYLLKSIEAH